MKFGKLEVSGWEAAIRGMRNPLNSHDRSDTAWQTNSGLPIIGENDLALMKKLCKAGSEHRKFMRYIIVTFDLTAPMYVWSQVDTYKIGTVRNSTSKMHKLLAKEFSLDDFETEGLTDEAKGALFAVIDTLNTWRKRYLELPEDAKAEKRQLWDAILKLLPESYCQTSTLLMNYEVLRNIYRQRKTHKLREWRAFCAWISDLPYSKLITDN